MAKISKVEELNNMSNTALGLTALLLVIPIIISYKEGLHIIKDLIVADTTLQWCN